MLFMMLGGLFFWTCMASLLPTLPAYIKAIGTSDHELGMIMGSFAVGLLLFRPKMGQMIDTRGRKSVLLLGIAVAAIAPPMYIYLHHPVLLIALRIFHGLSIAAFTTSYSTLVVDLSPPQNRGELIGYMSLVNPIGMAIGPALGGYLQPMIGYQSLFWGVAGLGAVSWLCSSMVRTPALPIVVASEQTVAQNSWQLITGDRFRVPTLNMFSVGLAFGTMTVYLPLFIQQMHFDMNVGLFYTMSAIASFGMRLFSGRASDRLGRGLFITIGLLCYALSLLMLWQAQDVTTILVAGLIQGIGGGTLLPITIALITDRAQPQERGRVYSLCIGGFDLGIFMAGPCVGFLAGIVGYRGLFAIAMLVTLFSMIIFVTAGSRTWQRSWRFAIGRGRDVYALSSPSSSS
jgi:MFS family permease